MTTLTLSAAVGWRWKLEALAQPGVAGLLQTKRCSRVASCWQEPCAGRDGCVKSNHLRGVKLWFVITLWKEKVKVTQTAFNQSAGQGQPWER